MKQRFLFLFTFLLTFPYGMCDNYLIINQILYDTPLNEVITSTPYSNGEFIELYNGGTDSVSLKGWYLRGDGKTEIYQFPDSISIASRHYLIVAYRHKTTPDFSLLDMLMTSPPQHLQIIYQQDIVLANGGETISLYNASNEIVDQIYYDGTSHKTNPKRLCADNADGLAGHLCGSIRRSWVEFDETGHAIISASKWITSKVALSCALMHELFTEEYIAGEQPLSYDANYRISVTPLDATSRISCNDGKISMSSGIRTQSTIQYHDGLGRDYESITISACPDKRDLVNFTQYSGLDRPTKYWLPISRKTDGQPISETDYIAEAQSVYSDSRSYYEVEYEKSALNRVAGKKKPGEKWAQHAYTYSYDTNTEIDNVRIYSISSGGLLGGESGEYLQTASTTYAPSSLTKITACDEDGMRLTTFYDKLGRKIMERRSENITYYVYNDKGQLRYILPHKAAQHLTNGTYNLEQEISLIENAYCYQYDERGNIIYKRLPGCEPQYLVYDRMNHLVLKQDANQRIHDKWTLYAYDSIGRNLYSAEIQTTETHQSLINKFRNQWQVEHYSTGKQSNALGKTGYAISLMHSSDVKILIVNYYDTYDFLNRLSSDSKTALKYVHQEGYGIIHNDATGLLTGTHIYSLEEDCASVNTYYYDYKGRIIQNKTLQISGACHCLYTEYNFDGSIAKQLIEHSEGTQITTEHYRHTYDHAGRLTNTLYQLNNKPEIVLCHYTYDNLGRMIQNTRHNYSDTLHYSYDLRNATTLIQSEHFSEQLYYADSLENNMTACYNGNISASKITHNKEEHQYTYTYDGMNRLTDTHSLVKLSNSNTILKRNCEHMGYDILGNIVTLQRYDEEKLVDDLMYSYVRGGNQVHSITDYADPSDMYSVTEYEDNHSDISHSDMSYDPNGNLISDKDRGISWITYNLLNLPDTIQFGNGNQIVNFYRADGYKYKSIYFSVMRTLMTPCYDVMHYSFDNDTIVPYVKEFNHNFEKHYSRIDTILRIFNKEGYYQGGDYYYYYNDHLGNRCAVKNMSKDTIVQRTMYYPSGVPMSTSWGQRKQDKKYNSKEYITAYGYNTYDYGFRNYYATIGRFTGMDPMAELTPWQSPYVYAGNNGIANIDYMGLVYMQHGKKWLSSIDEEPLQYTEINNDGIVVLHRDDDDDKRVMIVKDDGSKAEIGSELEDERYIVGYRAYFRRTGGGIRMVYNYRKGISVSPNMTFDERMARWLRAKGVDEWEKRTLEAQRPFIQGIVLAFPIISQFNDAKTLTTGANIYGTPADETDYLLSTISLLTFGVGNVVTNKTVKDVLKWSGYGTTAASVGKNLQDEHEKEQTLQ